MGRKNPMTKEAVARIQKGQAKIDEGKPRKDGPIPRVQRAAEKNGKK